MPDEFKPFKDDQLERSDNLIFEEESLEEIFKFMWMKIIFLQPKWQNGNEMQSEKPIHLAIVVIGLSNMTPENC